MPIKKKKHKVELNVVLRPFFYSFQKQNYVRLDLTIEVCLMLCDRSWFLKNEGVLELAKLAKK